MIDAIRHIFEMAPARPQPTPAHVEEFEKAATQLKEQVEKMENGRRHNPLGDMAEGSRRGGRRSKKQMAR